MKTTYVKAIQPRPRHRPTPEAHFFSAAPLNPRWRVVPERIHLVTAWPFLDLAVEEERTRLVVYLHEL